MNAISEIKIVTKQASDGPSRTSHLSKESGKDL
jgi:hypothetical protein